MPDHDSPPAVSDEDSVQAHNYQEISVAANNRESVQYDYLVKPPADRSCYTPPAEYDVVVDTKPTRRGKIYSEPKVPVVTDNCVASGTAVHNTDEQ